MDIFLAGVCANFHYWLCWGPLLRATLPAACWIVFPHGFNKYTGAIPVGIHFPPDAFSSALHLTLLHVIHLVGVVSRRRWAQAVACSLLEAPHKPRRLPLGQLLLSLGGELPLGLMRDGLLLVHQGYLGCMCLVIVPLRPPPSRLHFVRQHHEATSSFNTLAVALPWSVMASFSSASFSVLVMAHFSCQSLTRQSITPSGLTLGL